MFMIAHKLRHYNPQVFISEDEKPLLRSLKVLKKEQQSFQESSVYLGKHSDTPKELPEKNTINIISLGCSDSLLKHQKKPNCNLIILDANLDRHTIFNEIQDIFTFYQDWDDELQDSLIRGKGIQHITDTSFKVFENPMYVIDPSFRTLSYTREVSSDAIDALWKSIVVEGHTDIATVNAMKENNALSWLNSCWEPIINTSPIFSSPRINANIMKGPEKIGTLIIIEAFTKLEKAHLHMANTW